MNSQPGDEGDWAPFSVDEKAWVNTEQKEVADIQPNLDEHHSDNAVNSSDETDEEQHHSSSEDSSREDEEMGRINHVSSWAEESNSSVEEECVDDGDTNPWLITEEQRGYYLKQFKILQPLESGVIKGSKARDFFMKSGLPKDILSSIWKMSDLNKDNALNLQEFCIAMHLVVAVRHGIELPETLPLIMLPHEYQDSTQVDPFSLPVQRNHRISPEPDRSETSCKSPEHWAIFSQDIKDSQEKAEAQEDCIKNEITLDVHQEHLDTVRTYERSVSDPNVSEDISSHQQDSNLLSTTVGEEFGSPKSPPPSQSSERISQPLARPRGKVKAVPNLMDAGPGQLLPPPSGKDIREGKNIQLLPSHKKATSFPSSGSVPSSPPPVGTSVFVIQHRQPSVPQDSEVIGGPSSPPVSPTAKTYAQVTANSQVSSNEVEEMQESVETSRPESPQAKKEDTNQEEKPELRKHRRTTERPRSFSGDSLHSVHVSSLPNTPSGSTPFINDSKRGPAPPPPPRRKGHSRSSSLDLNKLFGTKSKGSSSSSEKVYTPDSPKIPLPSVSPSKEKESSAEVPTSDVTLDGIDDDSAFLGENFADFSRFDSFIACQTDHGSSKVHRRSLSLDHSHQFMDVQEPDSTQATQKVQNDELTKSSQETTEKPVPKSTQEALPRPVAKKKPPCLPIVPLKKPGETETSKEVGERRVKTEPPKVVVKPVTKSSLLHNKIRDLKDKNSAHSRLNNELQQELKELMEERTSLEVQLDRLQPFKHNS